MFDAPPRIVFAARSTPGLVTRRWAPKSIGMRIVACEKDLRTGGGYRLEFVMDGMDNMVFHGRNLEVVPDTRLVWTNEEEDDGAGTTVSFEAVGEQTRLTYRDLYPTAEAFDAATDGAVAGLPEQFGQLDALLAGTDAA